MRGVATWLGLSMLLGCASVSAKRVEIEGLQQLIAQAEGQGARRCAPRELALAAAHTKFAAVALDQANAVRAEEHLILARPNAQAAYDLSPPSRCSEPSPVPVQAQTGDPAEGASE